MTAIVVDNVTLATCGAHPYILQRHTHDLTAVSRDAHMIYLYVPKCASTSSKSFMKSYFGDDVKEKVHWADALELASEKGSQPCVTLTFTRDPVERLISAVAEVRERARAQIDIVREALLTPAQEALRLAQIELLSALERLPISVSSLTQQLELVLSFSEAHGTFWNEHFMPQVAFYGNAVWYRVVQPQPVFAFPLGADDAVGRGWRAALTRLVAARGGVRTRFNASAMPREIHANPSLILEGESANDSFLRYVHQNATLLRRICHLYHIDYACLRLPRPAPCA